MHFSSWLFSSGAIFLRYDIINPPLVSGGNENAKNFDCGTSEPLQQVEISQMDIQLADHYKFAAGVDQILDLTRLTVADRASSQKRENKFEDLASKAKTSSG